MSTSFALTILPMLFNDYTGKRKAKIQQELSERHERRGQEKAAAEKKYLAFENGMDALHPVFLSGAG